MNMPRVLNGHSMTPKGMLRPVSMKLSLKVDGMSTATLVIDQESPDVDIGDWLEIWAPNGEMCVMYVKTKQRDYITGQDTITAEHVFRLLDTMVIFGEKTPADMGGGETTVAIGTAISYLLSQQTETLFQKGACDFSTAQGWKFTNSDIYSDLKALTESVMDCQWEFNFSTWPWTLSLKQWPSTQDMEMRRNRNLSSMKITMDRSGMFTRAYPMGKNNLNIDGVNNGLPYIDRNTATWGVVSQVIMESTIGDANLLLAWAQTQLKKNAEPKISVSITGFELSQSTGEPLDKLRTGRICRVPLPEYNTTVSERLVEMSWRDAIAEPENISCTLANEHKTMSGMLYEIVTGNGGGGGGGGGGGKRANVERECELGEDEEMIEEFDNSDIWINRDSVWAVCGSYDVITTAEGKTLRVKEGTALKLMRDNTEWGVYDQGNLTGGICIKKINDDETTLTIKASRIDIDGVVESLQALDVMVANFNASSGEFTGDLRVLGDTTVLDLSADDLECNTLTVNGDEATWQSQTVVTAVSITLPTVTIYNTQVTVGSVTGYLVKNKTDGSKSISTGTIHYLGSATT